MEFPVKELRAPVGPKQANFLQRAQELGLHFCMVGSARGPDKMERVFHDRLTEHMRRTGIAYTN